MSTKRVELTGLKETLLYPLYARALDARSARPILGDNWARDALERIDYPNRLKVKVAGNGHRHTLSLRAKRFDTWTRDFITANPDAVVVQLACGLDTRAFRLGLPPTVDWYDVDFPEIIEIRREVLPTKRHYHMIGASVTDRRCLDEITTTARPALVIAEGLVMYLPKTEVRETLTRVTDHFSHGQICFEVLPPWAATVSKVLSADMWGLSDPGEVEEWNPAMSLLESAPVLADYRQVSFIPARLLYGLLNTTTATRNLFQPLRFGFGA